MGKKKWGWRDNHGEMQQWEADGLLDVGNNLYPGILDCQAPGNCIHPRSLPTA